MKSFTKYFSIIPVIVFITFTGFTQIANAQTSVSEQYTDIQNQGIIFAGICSGETADCECRDSGKCTLSDILQVLVNFSIFILAISGAIMLLMFIYGGFLWILSHGNSQMIETGEKTLTGAVVGLIIILGAYTAINILLNVLTFGDTPHTGDNIEDVLNADGVLKTE